MEACMPIVCQHAGHCKMSHWVSSGLLSTSLQGRAVPAVFLSALVTLVRVWQYHDISYDAGNTPGLQQLDAQFSIVFLWLYKTSLRIASAVSSGILLM